MGTALATINPKLSPQEKQLVEALLNEPGFDLAKAADKCGLPLTAALEVSKRPDVRKALGMGLLTEKRDRKDQLQHNVLTALWAIATYDVKDLFDDAGGLRHPANLPPELRAAIKGVKQGKYGLEYTFTDRAAVLMFLSAQLEKIKEDGDQEKQSTVLKVYETEETC